MIRATLVTFQEHKKITEDLTQIPAIDLIDNEDIVPVAILRGLPAELEKRPIDQFSIQWDPSEASFPISTIVQARSQRNQKLAMALNDGERRSPSQASFALSSF